MSETAPKPPRPWDYNPELDTPESFPYFKAYRNAKGSRSLQRVRFSVWERGARPGVAPTMEKMAEWYKAGKWSERAAAWDGYLDQIHQEERECLERQTAEEMALRHRRILGLQTHVVEREWEKLAGDVEREDNILKPRELVSATDSLIKNERLHHGEATERVEGLGSLTDQDLELMESLLAKMATEGKKDGPG